MIDKRTPSVRPKVIGVILAGGQSRRFGEGDKFLKKLGGKTLIERIVERAEVQTDQLILNLNGSNAQLEALGLPIIQDSIQGYAGPLAGILSGMEWARGNARDAEWIVSFPSDAPFIPHEFVDRLLTASLAKNAEIACAVSGGRTHPVCALWRVGLADDLRTAMIKEGMKKIDLWTERHRLVEVEFDDQEYDPFFNINHPEDLAQAEQIFADLRC